ncbi:UxaA family hydrolase [Oxalobacter aliiformigenes]|uniref:UxaA family hydrolase n=1 Tax=Oxalobacter aliiformigenes TaxID=2946593 RepID=UPI0022AEB155|nr:UxaA family hydrolase [Oxalobacter aliiformigenes]MCZ4065758.1 UxaA family hydrolase [Oxalobacter aliiformigenes]WAV99865.1 UxaA family hydrolase [Oxalobacter aliiformigenes]
MNCILVINAADNTGSALEAIPAGKKLHIQYAGKTVDLVAIDAIPFGFKIAIQDIPEGKPILKYGEVIGEASRDILAGECVHIHNVNGKRA